MSWSARWTVWLVLILGTATTVLGNYSSSFKEVAALGGAIILARCSAGPPGSVVCKPLEVWRGKQPTAPLSVVSDDWGAGPVGGLERDPEARFLLIVNADGHVGCLLSFPNLGHELPILGDRSV